MAVYEWLDTHSCDLTSTQVLSDGLGYSRFLSNAEDSTRHLHLILASLSLKVAGSEDPIVSSA